MGRIVKAALIQTKTEYDKQKDVDKHVRMIAEAAQKGAQVVCLQEVFNGPYFCAEQDSVWYDWAETIPGPTMNLMQDVAKKHNIVIIVPIYEKVHDGVYYNTAGVIDHDGQLLGIYRKNHIPQVKGFWEKFYFKPGNLGYPVFETAVGKIGVYICYDRHFPDGARILGLNGAEIVFNPSATVEGLSRYLWELEQPAHAVANGYFVGAINRVGTEKWNTGKFYGSSYFCNPRGQIFAKCSDDKEEVLVSELNMDMIKEVRDLWQFYRDRRPETYGRLVELAP
jgi:beta-ureidopropionase